MGIVKPAPAFAGGGNDTTNFSTPLRPVHPYIHGISVTEARISLRCGMGAATESLGHLSTKSAPFLTVALAIPIHIATAASHFVLAIIPQATRPIRRILGSGPAHRCRPAYAPVRVLEV